MYLCSLIICKEVFRKPGKKKAAEVSATFPVVPTYVRFLVLLLITPTSDFCGLF